MSIQFNSNSNGFSNNNVNLMQQAVELARDGNLNADDLAKLDQTARTNGTTTEERTFLKSLKTQGQNFVDAVQARTQQSEFDPNDFTWEVQNRTLYTSSSGKQAVVVTSDNPMPFKTMGDIGETSQSRFDSLIPQGRQSEWQNLDKHNISAVKNFMDSLNLSPENQIRFAEAYKTEFFYHPGLDIEWNGITDAQEAMDTMPSMHGKKAADCELFLEIDRQLLGENRVKSFVVDANHSGAVNHQVGLIRRGNQAFVVSNNQITPVANARGRSDAEIIQEVYPEFSQIAEDLSGPMRMGTEQFELNQTLNHNGTSLMIDKIVDGQEAKALRTYQNDNGDWTFEHVTVRVDPATGDWTVHPGYQQGDTIAVNGGTIVMENATEGHFRATDSTGQGQPLRLVVTEKPQEEGGGWTWTTARRR